MSDNLLTGRVFLHLRILLLSFVRFCVTTRDDELASVRAPVEDTGYDVVSDIYVHFVSYYMPFQKRKKEKNIEKKKPSNVIS